MKPDANNIGADRAVQDPQDAIKQAGGTYKDTAEGMSEAEKIDFLPKGPDPAPFTLTGGGGGGGGTAAGG